MLCLGKEDVKFSLFIARDDKALATSEWIWGGVERLGGIDPEVEPYKSQLSSAHVKIFDLTALKSDDGLNHGKFAKNPEIVQLLGRRLAAGESFGRPAEGVGNKILENATGGLRAVEKNLEKTENPDE
jgi:esterase/lipase superfamily enzyme